MPPRTIRILRAAAAESRAAWRWYRARNPDAASGFLAEYDRALQSIADAPERWPPHLYGTRRLLFRRYPYTIIYRVTAEEIEVVAVAHQHRSPDYWRRK